MCSCICICRCTYAYIYIYVYMYMYFYMVTRGYLPLGYLLILAFRHVQIVQPLQHFVCSVIMKVAFRCGFSTHTCSFSIGICKLVLLLPLPASISFKSRFSFARPVHSKSHTWSFPTLWSSWHGCPNCVATRNPKHTTLVVQQCHLQVCLWREETEETWCSRSMKKVLEVPRTCWKLSMKSILEVPRTCWKRSIESVLEFPRTCWKRSRSSKNMLKA